MLGDDDFKASNGWLFHFKDCYDITIKLIHGEDTSTLASDMNIWCNNIMKEITEKYVLEGGYLQCC